MLVTFLAESAGNPSKLGGVLQKGLRIIRKVFHGGNTGPGQPSDQCLTKVAELQRAPLVAVASSKILSAVTRNARGIFSNFLARNQLPNLAAEMSRRYAFRLMSGSPRFHSGLSSRIALFGFVGISFGGAVHNRIGAVVGDECVNNEFAIRCLFNGKPDTKCVIKPVYADDEEMKFSRVRRRSIAEESDITVISDDESDFEILTEAEICLVTREVNEETFLDHEVSELKELIELEANQNANLKCIVQTLCQENAALKEILHYKNLEENLMKKELNETLKTMDKQKNEFVLLYSMIEEQTMHLKKLLGPKSEVTQTTSHKLNGKGPCPNFSKTPMDLRLKTLNRSCEIPGSSEIDMERLRAQGGRVRALKIHRKQRYRKN